MVTFKKTFNYLFFFTFYFYLPFLNSILSFSLSHLPPFVFPPILLISSLRYFLSFFPLLSDATHSKPRDLLRLLIFQFSRPTTPPLSFHIPTLLLSSFSFCSPTESAPFWSIYIFFNVISPTKSTNWFSRRKND